MHEVTVSRTLAADADTVRTLVEDRAAFMGAAGFDAVRVRDETVRIQKRVGLFDVELIVECYDDPESVLAYEQVEGIFESMDTVYTLVETDEGCELTATTTFEAVDLPIVGKVLDATVVKRQRRSELHTQLDWLASQLGA